MTCRTIGGSTRERVFVVAINNERYVKRLVKWVIVLPTETLCVVAASGDEKFIIPSPERPENRPI